MDQNAFTKEQIDLIKNKTIEISELLKKDIGTENYVKTNITINILINNICFFILAFTKKENLFQVRDFVINQIIELIDKHQEEIKYNDHTNNDSNQNSQ